jgi:hypothetical protein
MNGQRIARLQRLFERRAELCWRTGTFSDKPIRGEFHVRMVITQRKGIGIAKEPRAAEAVREVAARYFLTGSGMT